MKLGTLLLREAAISLGQLEAALRTQVLYGGRLGTNLVELGFLDLDSLGIYLAEVAGVPAATQNLFENASPVLIEDFGPERAERYGAFPLHISGDPLSLAAAMIDPLDSDGAHQLAEEWGTPVIPHVAPELRLLYYLERHYGISRKQRFVRTGTRRAPPPSEDRRRSQPAGGLVIPPVVRLEPRSRRLSSESMEPAPTPPAPPPVVHEPVLGYQNACDALDAADHRNRIADVFVEFAVGRFAAAVVFLVRDGNALGWRLHLADRARMTVRSIDELALPLGGTSALQAANDAAMPFRGPSPSPAYPFEKRLWDALGVDRAPAEMLVVPVIVKQRVVNLVYVHGLGGGPLPDGAVAELAELAVRASAAYVRLIRVAKGGSDT
jgi:hypothetical protein